MAQDLPLPTFDWEALAYAVLDGTSPAYAVLDGTSPAYAVLDGTSPAYAVLDGTSPGKTKGTIAKGRDATNNHRASSLNLRDLRCGACASGRMMFDQGGGCFVCERCGKTTEMIPDESPEMTGDDGRDVSRCGMIYNAFLPSTCLGTVMTGGGYSRVKIMHNWSHVPYRERSMAEVLNKLEGQGRRHKIPKSVIDGAKILYKKIRECKVEGRSLIFRGGKLKQLISACLLFAAELEQQPLSVSDVARVWDMDERQVTKGCRRYWQFMTDSYIVSSMRQVKASEHIGKLGGRLKIDTNVKHSAQMLADNLHRLNIATNHQPPTIAAVSILTALLAEKGTSVAEESRQAMAESFGVSPTTLQQMQKEIAPYVRVLLSQEKMDVVLRRKREILLLRRDTDDDIVCL